MPSPVIFISLCLPCLPNCPKCTVCTGMHSNRLTSIQMHTYKNTHNTLTVAHRSSCQRWVGQQQDSDLECIFSSETFKLKLGLGYDEQQQAASSGHLTRQTVDQAPISSQFRSLGCLQTKESTLYTHIPFNGLKKAPRPEQTYFRVSLLTRSSNSSYASF